MDKDKERQEISLLGRLLSMEALLVLMGLFSLISGIIDRDALRIIPGIAIISALILLIIMRRRRRRKNNSVKKDGSGSV